MAPPYVVDTIKGTAPPGPGEYYLAGPVEGSQVGYGHAELLGSGLSDLRGGGYPPFHLLPESYRSQPGAEQRYAEMVSQGRESAKRGRLTSQGPRATMTKGGGDAAGSMAGGGGAAGALCGGDFDWQRSLASAATPSALGPYAGLAYPHLKKAFGGAHAGGAFSTQQLAGGAVAPQGVVPNWETRSDYADLFVRGSGPLPMAMPQGNLQALEQAGLHGQPPENGTIIYNFGQRQGQFCEPVAPGGAGGVVMDSGERGASFE